MIKLEFVYLLMGAMVGGVSVVDLLDRQHPTRFRNGAFWGIYALTFLVGSHLSDLVNGLLVIVMTIVASIGLGQSRAETTTRDVMGKTAQIDYVGFFVEPPAEPIHVYGSPGIPPLVSPPRRPPAKLEPAEDEVPADGEVSAEGVELSEPE